MIEQLLHAGRAPFITVRDGRLHVDGTAYTDLTVQIHEVRPVRKLFVERKLKCVSENCRTGKNGRFCELCPDRRACSRRLQLRLLYRDEDRDSPAILEVPSYSFRTFDRLLEKTGGLDRLQETLVVVSAVRAENGWTNLQFDVLF
jgi:hypothetical protein